MQDQSTRNPKILKNVIWVAALLAFHVACSSSRVNPAYKVEYPFTGAAPASECTEVKARVVQVKRNSMAPLSVNGFRDLEVEILRGVVPKHPELKTFWVAVREHGVINQYCIAGKELTLRFDGAGDLIAVAEFEAAMLFQQRLFPSPPPK